MKIDRRRMLQAGGITALSATLPQLVRAQPSGSPAVSPQGAADQTIRIGNGLAELAPDRIISTTLYNGQFPGPLLRLKEGQRVVVDIHANRQKLAGRTEWSKRRAFIAVDASF
jgi:FtsP/CotA-like multicopper oxidase with cupredoxin domain